MRSAMPISQAYRLCPHGIYLSPNMRKYVEASNAMFEICERYTPLVERVSVDEGYLDVTQTGPHCRTYPGEIRRRSESRSAGAYCKYLAKTAAEEANPTVGGGQPR